LNKTEVAIGIDIGGTNTVLGMVSRNGKILEKTSMPTNADKPAAELFERIYNEIKILNLEKYKLKGIGVGAPNANYYSGCIETPPNLSWENVNVIDLLSKYFDIPIALTNDANAAALGEMLFGVAKGMKNFIEITLGTGLGSGIVVNGKLVYGHDGFAGELGHVIVKENGRKCGCGRKGCLETYASATGIVTTVFELLKNSNDSVLKNYSSEKLNSKIIFEAAKNNDKIALEAFDFTAKILGKAIANAVAITSPEAIILFGGLAKAGNLLFPFVKKYMEENILNIFKNKVKILPSGLEESDAAILGSAALIWEEISK